MSKNPANKKAEPAMATPPTEGLPEAASQQAGRQRPGAPVQSHTEVAKKKAEVAKTATKKEDAAPAMAPPPTASPAAASQLAGRQGPGAPVQSHADLAKKKEAEVAESTPAKKEEASPAMAPPPTEASPSAASQQTRHQGPQAPVQSHAEVAKNPRKKDEAMARPPTEGPPAAASPLARRKGPEAPVELQVEADTLRARVAAMTKKLQDFLLIRVPGLRRLIAFLTGRRVIVGDMDKVVVRDTDQPAADKKTKRMDQNKGQQNKAPDPPRRGGLSKLHAQKIIGNRPPPPPSPPPADDLEPAEPRRQFPPQEINDVTDEDVVKRQYAQYCRRRATCPESSIICHMCVFNRQMVDHCTVLRRDIVVHSIRKHENIGIPCSEENCFIRVDKEEELNRHKHFCHDLPADCWRSYY